MRERQRILERWQRGGAAAMVTLVRVEGSSYRRAGARMLIAEDGTYVGTISGGCLEAEVVRKALWKVRNGPVMERFSTLFDDTAEVPYGLGCGGTVDLLFEPAGTPEFAALMQAMEASLRHDPRQVETQLPEDGVELRRTVRDAEGKVLFASAGAMDAAAETFAETLHAPQRLVLFGAGDDARPLVQMAALLGWSVTVVDGRAQWARAERFPEADAVVAASPCQASAGQIAALHLGVADAVVLMTHSYEQDRAWLTAVLPLGPRYLGLLGARHRSALLVSEAAATLGWTVARVCEQISAPVGLDLGGDGAEAIALAVVAEIQACVEGRLQLGQLGTVRRMTAELVAEQIAEGGASRYLQTQCAL